MSLGLKREALRPIDPANGPEPPTRPAGDLLARHAGDACAGAHAG